MLASRTSLLILISLAFLSFLFHVLMNSPAVMHDLHVIDHVGPTTLFHPFVVSPRDKIPRIAERICRLGGIGAPSPVHGSLDRWE